MMMMMMTMKLGLWWHTYMRLGSIARKVDVTGGLTTQLSASEEEYC